MDDGNTALITEIPDDEDGEDIIAINEGVSLDRTLSLDEPKDQ